ncbi:ABC transporter ATP-binding protein/permease, partial [Pelagibacteraceae bacterium]|nr:ABC transporter ATP-binding protein/permease [Pelagibacteraceae bacterium]
GKITMDGFKEIRILQKDNYFFDEYKKVNKIFADIHLKYDTNLILPKFLLESSIIFVIMVLTISIVISSGNTSNSIALIGIFTVSAARIIPVVYNIFNSVGTILGSIYSINKIYRLIISNEVKQNSKNININLNEITNFKKIEFNNVRFGYDNTDIIKDTNFKINKGEIIGLSGDSGSGKTTLINLMIGFLKPNSGKILVNGFDIQKNLISWQSKISYISQQNFVYGASILENITLEKDKDKINFKKFEQSLVSAHLDDFINQLKEKENTIISDQVLNISGGQRQRIAIARSFYFSRDFIILDESLNALQENLQEQIINDLKRNDKNLTIIIVSHNKKNLNLCDYVYDLDNGMINKKI